MPMQPKPLIIAHRGGKFWKKGTDFSYITEAIRDGADIIELDIRLKKGEYIVQHGPFGKNQGRLDDALKVIGSAGMYPHSKLSFGVGVYLDLKSKSIAINELIAYIRSRHKNQIIVGSFHADLLKRITDPSVIKICHCLWPSRAVSKARDVGAHWVSPLCYVVTPKLARQIEAAGFKFVPGGSTLFKKYEIFKKQLQFANYGAHAIATHHVGKFKLLLRK